MKAFLFSMFFASSSLFPLLAQPVFTLDSLINPNSLLTYRTFTIDGNLVSPGPNQQWDYSFNFGDEGMLYRLGNINQFPMLNAPEGANKLLIKLFENGESPEDQMNFLRADADGLERMTIRADGLNYAAYSTPYRELNFPVVYNPDQVLYSTSVTFTDPVPFSEGDSIRTHRNIELFYNVPAYGSLTLPGGNTYEVLVIQRLESVTDSIEIYNQGVWTPSPATTYFNEFYDFLSPSLGYYVMIAKLIEGFKGTAYEIYYLHEINTVGMQTVAQPEVSIYPNPANNQIFLKGLNSPSNIQLMDLQGKIVQQWHQVTDGVLELDHHHPGIYFMRAINKSVVLIQKLIIQ
ncbi:MAG: T9SS type A sorting domain-containing protein [Flavobacteriales bacterium]